MEYTREQLIEKVTEIVSLETHYPVSSIEPKKSLSDELDIDSISILTIFVNIDTKIGVRIPEELWPTLTTVEKIVDYLVNNDKE